MNVKFYTNFSFMLLKRNSRNIVKEVFLGAVFSIMLMIIYKVGVMWGNLVVLSYSLLVHITCMVENRIFFSYEDFMIFNFKGNTTEFKLTYLLQRVLLDTFVANSIIIVSVFLFLSITSNFANALFFLTFIITCLWLMPSYNFFGYKIGERGIIVFATILVIGLVAIIVGSVNNIHPFVWFFSGDSYLHPFLLIFFTFVYVFILDVISKHDKSGVKTNINTRFFFQWLKPISEFMFKDYVLFYQNVLLNMIMIITLYSLVIIGAFENIIPFLVAFIIGGSNMFAVRKNKAYNLIAEDPFFDEKLLKLDSQTIRLSKLKTILSGAVIKVIIGFSILFYHGIYEMMVFFSLAMIMIIGSLIEFIVVYRNRLSSTVMNKILVYTAIIVFGISTYFDTYYTLLWLYLMILLFYSFIHAIYLLQKDEMVYPL